MPYTLEILGPMATIRFHGEFTSADMLALVADTEKIDAMADVVTCRLVDLSDCDMLRLASGEVAQHAEIRRKSPIRRPVKTAFVAPTPLQFGFSRMYQTLNDNPMTSIKVFSSREEAMHWFAASDH